jgi:ribose 5-phosphate isomerase B
MKIAIASDHAGFVPKQDVVQYLSRLSHEVLDLGAYSTEPSDYPDFAEAVGKSIMDSTVERGILVCGSGVGVCVAANKMPGNSFSRSEKCAPFDALTQRPRCSVSGQANR